MKIKPKDIVKRIDSKEIIGKMSPEIRRQVAEVAAKQNVSIEEFVQSQLTAQLMEDDLVISSGALDATAVDIDFRADVRGRGETRVGGGIRIPIGRRR